MKKQDLIVKLQEKLSEKVVVSKKDLTTIVDAYVETLADSLAKREAVKLWKVGTLKPVYRKERVGVNPQNPSEKRKYPAKYALTVVATPTMKERLNTKKK